MNDPFDWSEAKTKLASLGGHFAAPGQPTVELSWMLINQMLALINQSNAAWQHVIHFLSRQHHIHGLHIQRQRGAVSLPLMISPERLSHMPIDGKLWKHWDKLFYHWYFFIGQIFAEDWLPLASMNTRHCRQQLCCALKSPNERKRWEEVRACRREKELYNEQKRWCCLYVAAIKVNFVFILPILLKTFS
jgi:hypothetical protein